MNDTVIPNYAKLPQPTGYRSYIKEIGPLALDHYALTMTNGLYQLGLEKTVTTSNVFCRSYLNNGETYKDTESDEIKQLKIPYLIGAGLGLVAEWFDGWKWTDRELVFLANRTVDDGKGNQVRAFSDDFLNWLSKQHLTLDIKVIPEGQMVAPNEPVMQITGPAWQQMCIEATTLQLISSSTNLTTVASQVRLAAQRPVRKEGVGIVEASAMDIEKASLSEMALRRALSPAAIPSARAAAIADWDATSNDYAGMCYGIPVMGTFAHFWVMLHDTQKEAFENWAKVYPGATVFLTDTYSTIGGVKEAIEVCKRYNLRLKGLRFDSGNMGYLSVQAKDVLKEAGYADAALFDAGKTTYLASDSVTVKTAASLFARAGVEAGKPTSAINAFGIGSTVAVNRDNPLLDFVMKLSAIEEEDKWRDVLKLSETKNKTTLPGKTDVIRYIDKYGRFAGDTIIPEDMDVGEGFLSRNVYSESTHSGNIKVFPKGAQFKRLLVPWMKKGEMIQELYQKRDPVGILQAAKKEYLETISRLDPSHLVLPPDMPHRYGVGIAEELGNKRTQLVNHINGNQSLAMQLARFGLQ
ncbi:MAG: hypothetical protein PHS57_01915 [Alphaproteobacteria bacterium]|nr:hypothetical protein [Alphaproteobacteria bacterium]